MEGRCVRAKENDEQKQQKNNTRDSNVVPHRSTNLARQCLYNFAEQTGSGAVTVVWSFLSEDDDTKYVMLSIQTAFIRDKLRSSC